MQAIINVRFNSQTTRHCLGLQLKENTDWVALLDTIIPLVQLVNPKGDLKGWLTQFFYTVPCIFIASVCMSVKFVTLNFLPYFECNLLSILTKFHNICKKF